jgi:hypothetical protein
MLFVKTGLVVRTVISKTELIHRYFSSKQFYSACAIASPRCGNCEATFTIV